MAANKNYKIGAKVFWKWMGRNIEGRVLEIFFEPVVKEIKGKKIKRNASSEVPAYLVESTAGNTALKLQTEIFAAGSETANAKSAAAKKVTPKMFR